MLALESLSISYDGDIVFHDVDFHLATSEICCVRTGVLDGSTSLLKCIGAIRPPSSGRCVVDDIDIHKASERELLRLVCYCYEAGGLVSLFNVYENIVLPVMYHGNTNPREMESFVREVARELFIEDCLDKQTHELNDVQTRMVNLARGVVIGSRLLLLDEIQEGMSAEMKSAVIAFLLNLREQDGRTILMTTTAGDDTSFADSVYYIGEKQLQVEH